ncbi:MAG: YHS domain-containing protein [Deltaproteobacteria bacterium]|nr:YHS domain-containing protein [Deltaproteobacteria bacterium]
MRTEVAALAAAITAWTAALPAARADTPPATAAKEVRCPVMGNVVADPATAPKSEYKGRTRFFCCLGCKPEFDADPEKYAEKADAGGVLGAVDDGTHGGAHEHGHDHHGRAGGHTQ